MAGIDKSLQYVSDKEVKQIKDTKYLWTTEKVNLRSEASKNSDILTTINKREKVIVKEQKTSSKWIEVKYKDFEGYIYSEYLRDTELPSLDFTDKEIEMLAKIVWLEARNQSDEGEAGIVIVVFNRILSEEFSDTMLKVLSDYNQFSTWKLLNTAKPTEREREIILETLHGEWDGLLTKDTVYFSTEPRNKNIVAKIGDHYFCSYDND
jgi:spore germination cell wall hydrolase CwlJ-like protein